MSGLASGLDFGAVMAVAEMQGVDLELLAEALPEVEIAMLAGISGEQEEGDE